MPRDRRSVRASLLSLLLALVPILPSCATPPPVVMSMIQGQVSPGPLAVVAHPLDDVAAPATPGRGDQDALPVQEPRTLRRAKGVLVPKVLVVAVGELVRFVNEDDIHHSYFSACPKNNFHLVTLGSGDSDTVRFQRPGRVPFYCSLHEQERGMILVVPSRYFDTVTSAGEFRIDGLPPGRYELVAWTRHGPSPTDRMTVEIGAGQQRRVWLSRGVAEPAKPAPEPR